MEYEEAAEKYRRAFDRLETELTEVGMTGQMATKCRPAVFTLPEENDLTAEEVHEAVLAPKDANPTTPVKEEDEMYYVSGRVYRRESEPDYKVTADSGSLRLFEVPYEPEEPLPRLSFSEFHEIVTGIESELDIQFSAYEEDEKE